MSDKKKKTGMVIFIIVAAIAIIFAALNIVAVHIFKPATQNEHQKITLTWSAQRHGYIAALHISGVIQEENQDYNQKWLLDTISRLKNDKGNKGMALFIDSPGGTVYEADEVYLALQDYKTSGKPVYAYMGHLAASGGYYISCAAQKIYANRNTLTGSIGVITGSSTDFSGFLQNLGIKSETIHAGKNKTMMNYNEPFTDEQRAIMQALADECYEQFTGIVSMNRSIPLNEVKKLADGRIYSANQALHNGLIDSVDSWENMIKTMNEAEFNDSNYKTIDFKYNKDKTLKDYIIGKSKKTNPVAELCEMLVSESRIQYPAYLYK